MPLNAPIDPRLQAAIVAAVRAALAEERELSLGPIKQEIVQLQATDRRHSGTHADLTQGLRNSKPEIEEAVMKRVAATLDAFRAEQRGTPVDAAQAKHAAMQAATNTAAVSFDTAQIRSKQDDQMTAARLRFWATLLPVIATAIATLYTAIFR